MYTTRMKCRTGIGELIVLHIQRYRLKIEPYFSSSTANILMKIIIEPLLVFFYFYFLITENMYSKVTAETGRTLFLKKKILM